MNRRDVLRTLPPAIAGVVLAGRIVPAEAQVKWSSGTEAPRLKAPANAADCHHHVYDARFPEDPKAVLHPPDALVDDYRGLQRRLGTSRSVIIQPSTYGTDNRCALAALAALGPSARMVAVVNDTVTDAELKRLDGLGVRGIRFNLAQAGATTPEMIEPLARRVTPLGWHLQINAPADRILEILPILERVPSPIVFDHLGHIPQPDGIAHPLFARIRALLDKGKTWVKLSGAYIDTKVGPPTYADATAVAQAYVKAAPERLVWGSDWPHPTEQGQKPDDAVLFDLLSEWAPDANVRHRILVENAAALYGFGK
ncbi:MAG TPA: amidohydrolase family protein [Vicinamibacterales bacterium]|nr:amidohydrolase family protein [Vicinamibacterales bacterium]